MSVSVEDFAVYVENRSKSIIKCILDQIKVQWSTIYRMSE